jgi:RNA polymerase sigma-70 factor, ECF subfamily
MNAAIAVAQGEATSGSGCTEDLTLIRDVRRGDAAAFEQLVCAHGQHVLRLALRITESQIDAQDVYQETFLRAFRKLGDFRYQCAFSTWIYRIATNVCLDHLRRKRTRKEASAIEVDPNGEERNLLNEVSDDRLASNPEQEALRRELRAHISRALLKLTPRERMVFELRHYQGMKLRTVGEILNRSEGSIKISLLRATKKLRPHLESFRKAKGSLSSGQ